MVASSTAEVECRAIAIVVGEATWLLALFKDLGFHSSAPATIHCDNHAAIHITSNPIFHE